MHTADDVQSRLKQIREALHETPAAEKQLARWPIIEQRNREILRALRGDVEIAEAKRACPVVDQRSREIDYGR